MKRIGVYFLFAGLILCFLAVKTGFFHSRSASNFSIACVDWDALTHLPAFEAASANAGIHQTLIGRLNAAVASVAQKKRIAVVLNKAVVVYGVPDMTPQVRAVFLSNQPIMPMSGSALTNQIPENITIGVVDLAQVMKLHPAYPRLADLTQAISLWRKQSSGMAATPVPPLNWILLSGKTGPPGKTFLSDLKMPDIGKSLSQGFQSYAKALGKFRGQAMLAKGAALIDSVQEKTEMKQADLQERNLQFEEKLLTADQPQKLALKLKVEVASGQEKEALSAELKALNVQEQAAIQAEQAGLRHEYMVFRIEEVKDITEPLRLFAANLDAHSAQTLEKRRQALLQSSQETLRRQEESFQKGLTAADLHALQNTAFPSLEMYTQTLRAIRAGKSNVASEAIARLQDEQTQLLEAIRIEIEKRAAAAAKDHGVQIVLDRVAVNRPAIDLTPEIANSLRN